MHIPTITDRYSNGSVHSTVSGSSKITDARMCFEKVGVALHRSNAYALYNSNPM